MSQEQIAPPAAGLFQRAHSKMVLVQRLDAQLAAIIEQRRKAQDELDSVQNQINEEFDRFKKESEETPIRLMGEGWNGDGVNDAPGLKRLINAVDEVARESGRVPNS